MLATKIENVVNNEITVAKIVMEKIVNFLNICVPNILPKAAPQPTTTPIRAIVKLYLEITIVALCPAIIIGIHAPIELKAPLRTATTNTTSKSPTCFLTCLNDVFIVLKNG